MSPAPSFADQPTDLPESGQEADARLWDEYAKLGSPEVRERLFMSYLPYAKALAARIYARRQYDDVDFKDFYQLACLGLLEALDRYQPGGGASFKTFSTFRIEGSILNGIGQLSEGQEQVSLQARVRKERLASLKEGKTWNTRMPDAFASLCEVAAGMAIGFMLEDTNMYLQSDEAAHEITAYHTAAWQQALNKLKVQVEKLPAPEKKIILYHYYHGLAFESIASAMSLSKGRISQLHRNALNTLRKHVSPADSLSMTK